MHGKVTKTLLKSVKSIETRPRPWKPQLIYAQAMRELCAKSYHALGLADQLASVALRRQRLSICGASLAPSVFGLVVKTANTHKTNENQ